MSSSPGERTIGVFRSGVQSAVISRADSKPLQESTTDFLLLSGSRRVSSFRANFYGKTTKNAVLTVKFRTDAAGEPTSGTSRGEPVIQVVLHGCHLRVGSAWWPETDRVGPDRYCDWDYSFHHAQHLRAARPEEAHD